MLPYCIQSRIHLWCSLFFLQGCVLLRSIQLLSKREQKPDMVWSGVHHLYLICLSQLCSILFAIIALWRWLLYETKTTSTDTNETHTVLLSTSKCSVSSWNVYLLQISSGLDSKSFPNAWDFPSLVLHQARWFSCFVLISWMDDSSKLTFV